MKIQLWEWLHPVLEHQIVDDQHFKCPKCFFERVSKLQGSYSFNNFWPKKKDRHFLVRKVRLLKDQSSWPSSSWLLRSYWQSHVISWHATVPANFRSSGEKNGGEANCFSVRNGWFFWGREVGDTHPGGFEGLFRGYFWFPFPFGCEGGFGDGAPRKKLGKLKDIHAILILSSPPFMGFSPRNFLEGAAIFGGCIFWKWDRHKNFIFDDTWKCEVWKSAIWKSVSGATVLIEVKHQLLFNTSIECSETIRSPFLEIYHFRDIHAGLVFPNHYFCK